jgi:hypothetical protein
VQALVDEDSLLVHASVSKMINDHDFDVIELFLDSNRQLFGSSPNS